MKDEALTKGEVDVVVALYLLQVPQFSLFVTATDSGQTPRWAKGSSALAFVMVWRGWGGVAA